MSVIQRCPECGAVWSEGQTCTDHFHMMGFWEMEYLLLDVHNLMVLSYYLQHPRLYSPEGLTHSMGLLVDFLERGLSTQDVRKRDRDVVDSGKRKFKIKGHPLRTVNTVIPSIGR